MYPAHDFMYVAHMVIYNSAAELRVTVGSLMGVHGESQEDLAAAIRLTQGQISRKLAGRSAFTLDHCDKIAAHYGITVPELLSGGHVAVTQSLAAQQKGQSSPDD